MLTLGIHIVAYLRLDIHWASAYLHVCIHLGALSILNKVVNTAKLEDC